jgi:hypothetical protein
MTTTLTTRFGLVAALSLLAFAAQAADVKISCEKRSNRSKVSIDGNNLVAGAYRAVALSGAKKVTSTAAAADGDEAEFDFDSNAADIAEGATAIPANFVVDGRVKGYLLNAAGARVTPVVTAICRVRK